MYNKEAQKRYYQKNKETLNKKRKNWYAKNKQRISITRSHNLKKLHILEMLVF